MRNILAQRFAISDMLLDWHERQQFERSPDSFSLVTGHRTFDDLRHFSVRPLVLVFLRDPVERALSAFFYYAGHSSLEMQYFERHMRRPHFEQRKRFRLRAGELGLLRFLKEEERLARLWMNNIQTRVLSGATDGDSQRWPEEMQLEIAQRNLARCDLFGLTEQMEKSLNIIGQRLGWNSVLPRFDNITRNRPQRDGIDPESLEILRDWNQLDQSLYETAALRFSQMSPCDGVSDSRPGSYPSACDFRFDQPITGPGWHPRELFQDRWICWTGDSEVASLELSLASSGSHLLECRLEHCLSPRILEQLRLYVNDQELNWQITDQEQQRWISATVPASVIARGRESVRLAFRIETPIRPSDLDSTINDHRALGVALSRIRMSPDATFPKQLSRAS